MKETQQRKYFTQIPNIVLDMGLSPIALTLYVCIKRVAGEKGVCFMSTTTLATKCHTSTGSITYAKKELVKRRLIEIREEGPIHYGKKNHHIYIIDIWKENNLKYSKTSLVRNAISGNETTYSPSEIAHSPSEIKNNSYKNNHIRKTFMNNQERITNSYATNREVIMALLDQHISRG